MVTTLNISLNDSDADRARTVKDERGLTWEEFIIEATVALENRGVGATEPVEVSLDSPPVTARPNSTPELDIPGNNSTVEKRRATIMEMRDYLRDQGTAQKKQFLELVDPEEVRYASADSFWSNVVKGRDTLASLPGVEAPPEGGHTWRWVG